MKTLVKPLKRKHHHVIYSIYLIFASTANIYRAFNPVIWFHCFLQRRINIYEFIQGVVNINRCIIQHDASELHAALMEMVR